MDDTRNTPPALGADQIGDVAATIATLAWTHGLTAEPEPVDVFVQAAARLSDAECDLDRTERLLLALARAGVVTDEERLALHVAYLHQKP